MKWMMYGKRADFYAIAEKFGIDPVIARVIRNRDVIGDESIEQYLHGDLDGCHDPILMKDMEKGCGIMSEKLRASKKVRIISDYDVDGVTSNYILYKGLQRVCEALEVSLDLVDYDIPHRIYDGYGVNVRMIDKAHEDGVDTIITCDNGIAAFAAVERAKELGMTVIVTDHHDIPYELDEDGVKRYKIVPADAVIDHKQVDCGYPFKEICGAGVAYKFIQLLYRMNDIPEQEVYAFIEYLGIATVCDVMNLIGENRVFVRKALERLPKSSNPGLRALIRNANLESGNITSTHLGFIIGPCINATGRLDSATTSLEFLLETDTYKAEQKAIELVNTNNERKNMTVDGANRAYEILEKAGGADMTPDLEANYGISSDDRVIVVYIPNLHESLAGIVAGRIRERYYKPTLVFTDAEEEGIIKGSGRSIEGYNMYEEINSCIEYFVKFGGHEMAAGFSAKKENLKAIRDALNGKCTLTEEQLTQKLMIDVPMPIDYVNLKITKQLNLLEPFGKANEKPTFAQSGIRVARATVMGKNRNVLKLRLLSDKDEAVEGIFFDPDKFISDIKMWFGDTECGRMLDGRLNSVNLDVAYYPSINDYNGRETLQLKILTYRKHEDN